MTEDGRSDNEILRRIGIGKSVFSRMSRLFTNREITLKTKLRMAQCFILSTVTYACETWSISHQMEKRITSLEMWLYRRILKISYASHTSNEAVLRRIGIKEPSLMKTIKGRKLRFYGHIRRHDTLQRILLEGKVEGRRGRGRRRQSWTTNIANYAAEPINRCSVLALDRNTWRGTVAFNPARRMKPR